MSKLLPCPFCGGEARMWPSHTKADQDGSYEIIGCSSIECPIEPTTDEYLPYEEAVQRWNTRAAPTPCDELVTVATQVRLIGDDHFRPFKPLLGEKLVEETRELVTRQNAEEVIAAKDARIAEMEKLLERTDRFAKKYLRHMKNTDKRNEALEAENKRLREALEAMLVPYEGSDCRRDHHGYCQEHCLEEDCCVAKARAVLGEVKL